MKRHQNQIRPDPSSTDDWDDLDFEGSSANVVDKCSHWKVTFNNFMKGLDEKKTNKLDLLVNFLGVPLYKTHSQLHFIRRSYQSSE